MANPNRVHIVSSGNVWRVKREGNQRATRTFGTQKEAIAYTGRTMSSCDVVVHKKDASISRWIKGK